MPEPTLTENANNPDKVAICIATFNQSAYLRKAVLSACTQTYPHIEVLVSDDCSTDDTEDVMKQLCQENKSIRYYRQSTNLGPAGNYNWLMNRSDCPFLVRLDSDDFLHPDYVQNLLAALKRYPKAGYAFAAVQTIDVQDKPLEVCFELRQSQYQEPEESLKNSLDGYHRVAAGYIPMLRAEALKYLNFFNQSLKYGDDYDMSLRMADEGFGNVYIPRVLAYYRIWDDSEHKRLKRKKLQLQGYVTIYEQTLTRAFEKRKWDQQILLKKRRKLAFRHLPACLDPAFNESERQELLLLLLQIGDSPAIKLYLLAKRFGLEMIFDLPRLWYARIRKLIKQILFGHKYG